MVCALAAGLFAAISLVRSAGGSDAPGSSAAAGGPVRFNREVRPILSDACFHCHGFDASKRKADLRLDLAEGARAVRDARQAIKPGDRAASELWRRIRAADPEVQMPPPASGKSLTPDQVELLGRWIDEGAAYQKHWAFEPPQRPDPPAVAAPGWCRTDLDRFILARLESERLTPSPEAARETLIRRVTLDLTGLPPTPAEVDLFLDDPGPDAYERLVDRLLASPSFGEHRARYWLDLARYGDTHGLHLDNERSMWPYRDWVVDAFNANLPYDQFTLWQLAGDLLPEPTRQQLIASGFNRCNVTTSEGGAIDEEFQVRYAVDRVETTSAVWMGLTLGCAVCHDHKLDPISQKEFYQVFTLFNNLTEKPMDGNALLPPPVLKLPSPEQESKLKDFDQHIDRLVKQAREAAAGLVYVDPASLTDAPAPAPRETVWVDDEFPAKAVPQVNEGNTPNKWVTAKDGPVFSGDRAIERRGRGIHQVFFPDSGEPLHVGTDARFYVHVRLDPDDPPKALMVQFRINGEWARRVNWGDADAITYGTRDTPGKFLAGPLPESGRWIRLEVDFEKLDLKSGTRITGLGLTQFDGTAWWDKAGLISTHNPATDPTLSFAVWEQAERKLGDKSTAPDPIKELLKQDPPSLTAPQAAELREHFLVNLHADPASPVLPLRAELKSVREKREAFDQEIPATLISRELDEPRPAWVLLRGQYDKHGEPVGPGVPSVLPPLPPADKTNRLTFARWLVDPAHPLTARVTVNHFWQQVFGVGLVKTTEDFGTRGEWPSHPELLDWLAAEFVRSGWDVKRLVRLLVTSAAYRQESRVSPERYQADPENRLLARGPRQRLDAEVLRDNALFVSGLLNPARGGRGVRPYQPSGIWEAVGYTTSNTAQYRQDHGEALYRRSLYLFWKRTAPPPSMTTFDAPSREGCQTRRERTNTPLQALLTLNDITYFEAARQLGYRMLQQGGATDADRIRHGFRWVTARVPAAEEAAVLAESLERHRAHYQADPEAARQAIAVGESPVPENVPPAELAAYTLVANLLLNLDETLTKN